MTVYGDFDALEVTRDVVEARRAPRAARRGDPGRADEGGRPPCRLTDEEALALFQAEGAGARGALRVADDLRREAVGDEVTYVVNRNINFTNVCYMGCRFCAFAQREMDAESYTLTLDEVADRAEEAWDYGATEVCIQGGHPPEPARRLLLRPPRGIVKARAPACTSTRSARWRS